MDMTKKLAALATAIASIGALARADNRPIVVGKTFKADVGFDLNTTNPTTGSQGWSLTSHGISENLFTVDKHGDIVPAVAESVAKVSEKVWDVKLKAGELFSDGTPVTSELVATCLKEVNTLNSNARNSLGVIQTEAVDGRTVRITTTETTHIMDSVLAYYAFPIYKKIEGEDGDEFVFTGPYVPDRYFKNDFIYLSPNEYYRDGLACQRPDHIKVKQMNGDALAEAVKDNAVDVAFHLPITTLPSIKDTPGAHTKTFETGYHYMQFYNMHDSTDNALADKDVRTAIDLAIDRAQLVVRLAGGKGTRSFYPDYTPYYQEHGSAEGDATGAADLLTAAGWVLDGGKRMKGGKALTVRLIAYAQRPGLPLMQPVIAQQLEALGITVEQTTTPATSWGPLDDIIAARSWDILMWAQNTLPAGDPLEFMKNFFHSDGGGWPGNLAKFNSSTVDDLLEQLSLKEDHDERVAASKAAMAAIIAENPASNLVTPGWHVGLSERMLEYEPYGSDYYVINAAFHEVGFMQSSAKCTDEDKTTAPGTAPPTNAAPVTTAAPTTAAPTTAAPVTTAAPGTESSSAALFASVISVIAGAFATFA